MVACCTDLTRQGRHHIRLMPARTRVSSLRFLEQVSCSWFVPSWKFSGKPWNWKKENASTGKTWNLNTGIFSSVLDCLANLNNRSLFKVFDEKMCFSVIFHHVSFILSTMYLKVLKAREYKY